MKITKVNTMVGEFKSPVSTELSAVVERMQAPKTKEIADRIASIALQSRLMIENGGPRYYLKDKDIPNLTSLGFSIKKLKWPKVKNNGILGYYLRLK